MARASFMMDKLMQKIGLHGKAFIPLIMGFDATCRQYGYTHARKSQGQDSDHDHHAIYVLQRQTAGLCVADCCCV